MKKEQKIQIENKVKKFIEIDKVYKVLSNQGARKKYDRDGCYKHQNDNEGSENQQYEYPNFWHNFENYCKEWSKLIRIGTLFSYIDLGNLEKCSSLIQDLLKFEEGADIHTKHNGSNHYISNCYLNLTPIEFAIQKDHEAILSLLVKNKAEISPNALHIAIEYNSKKVFHLLINEYGININYQDKDGNTALHHVFKWQINGSFDYSNSKKWSLKYDGFAESLLNKGAQFDIRNNNNTTSFDLFIDAVIENQNSINSYSNVVNKESLGTYQINIKQRERLYSILNLFVRIGINEIRYKGNIPALHKLKELGLYQFSPIPHEEKNTIKNLIPKQVSRVRSSSQEDKFKKHPNKLIIYGVVGAVFVTIGVGLAALDTT